MLEADVTEVLLSKGLLISSLDEDGLLAKWNRSFPDKTVLEGDDILAVNNVRADVEAMRTALYSDTVRMLVLRRSSSPCSASLQQRAALMRHQPHQP
mmetsp:Transcript_144591/g.255435  ORF Transcript_144591/g.255435 Transcript_144591/m.255435 type:complete len:97 (+) Transcript_144591:1-291(+)